MGTTSNLNLDYLESENTDWFNEWKALHEMVDDMGKMFVVPFYIPFDPVAGTTFFDAYYVAENITIYGVSLDAAAGAPGGDLVGDLLVGGSAQTKLFTIAGAAARQMTTFGTPLDVNAGSRVGCKWTTVPSDPGYVKQGHIYVQARALP